MIRNYLTIAVRQFVKQRAYTVLNIVGLAVGMACALLVIQFIREELRIGSDNTHADRIYRILRRTDLSGTGKRVSKGSSGGLRQAAIASIPEIDRNPRGDLSQTTSCCDPTPILPPWRNA